jgi:hypothetical protein
MMHFQIIAARWKVPFCSLNFQSAGEQFPTRFSDGNRPATTAEPSNIARFDDVNFPLTDRQNRCDP